VTQTLDPSGDQSEIRQLIERYAAAVDRGDGEAAAALFSETGEMQMWLEPGNEQPSATRRGRAAIATAINGLRDTHITQHVIANSAVDIDSDGALARGETQCIAHHVRLGDPEPRDEVLHIRYIDEFARIDGRWCITRRELWARWSAVHAVESM
jgi:uncharacterized protein (TIGR02246 family)